MEDQLAEQVALAMAALSGPRYKLVEVQEGAGLCAIYGGAESWLQLGLGQAPPKTALYVGKVDKSLSGRTGQSPVRRTFAALLRDHLTLRGIPRNQTKPDRFADFALSEENDAELTKWMTEHLEIAVWAGDAQGDVEVAILKRWSPPLNLRDTRSTWGAKVSAAHKVMTNDARAWARERGHKHG